MKRSRYYWRQVRLMLGEIGKYVTEKQVYAFIRRHFKLKEAR